MAALPKLTVVIPLYNNELHLAEGLESILNQTYTDFKVFISDDCSTDSSFAIATEYTQRDKRISVVRQKMNLGPMENWQEASKGITTPYFLWFTSQDILHPLFFEKAIKIHESNPNAVLVYPKALIVDEFGKISNVSADSDIDTSNLSVKDRVIKIANNLNACTAVYGVFKTKYLDSLPLKERIIGPDFLWLFTAGILGDILEMPNEILFYRRARIESKEETMNRYISWGIFKPTRYSPFARFSYKHFNAILKAKNISLKEKIIIIDNLCDIFHLKFALDKKDILYQFIDDLFSRAFNKKRI